MSAFLAPIHFWMYDKILIAQKLTFAVEEKFLNKTFGYTDTSDSFKIQKDSKGYFVTQYIDDSEEKDGSGPIKEEKVRLKLVKNVFLTEVDGDGLTYAYDTKLKKMVLINPANNYRIMFIVD